MTSLTDLCSTLDDLGIPWVNTAWREDDSNRTEPPYIVLMTRPSGGKSKGAADGTWLTTMEYNIELYCYERNYGLEREVEDALDSIRLYWTKDYYFIESESLAETVFTVTVRED